MLLEQPGEIVTRDEIQQRLWPDGIIVNFEVSINQAVSKLRHALNDSAAHPRFVETIGRRGYRLLVPVKPGEETPILYGRRKDDAIVDVPRNTTGAPTATETKAMAGGLLGLLQLLMCVGGPSKPGLQLRLALDHQLLETT